MADRGRDLKIAILSDVSKFDADKPADQLDDLADAARDAGQDLDKVGKDARDAGQDIERAGRDAKDAGSDFERLGRDAKTTADKVESSFDQIARAGKSSIGDGVREAADDAESGLRDMREESVDTAREMGASFSGSLDDIADAFQEMSANALAALGPIGAAAGIAGAIGLGVLKSQLEASAEEANAFKDRVIELAKELDEVDGNIDQIDLASKIREWSLEIEDNKSWWELWQKENLTRFEVLERKAHDLGLNFSDLLKGMSGHDADAASRTWQEITRRIEEYDRQISIVSKNEKLSDDQRLTTISNLLGEQQAYEDLRGELEENSGLNEQGIGLQERLAAALGTTTAELERSAEIHGALAEAIGGFVEPVDAYTAALERKAEAEDKSVEDTQVTIDEYLAELSRQVEAQEAWAGNLTTLTARGVDEGVVAKLAELGPAGAPLVAQFVTASDEQLRQLEVLFGKDAQSGVDAVKAKILAGKDPAKMAAAEYAAAVAQGFGNAERSWEAAGARMLEAYQRGLRSREVLPPRMSQSQELTQRTRQP